MKPSFGALVFLLLIVDSTLSAKTKVTHGEACNTKESAGPPEAEKAKVCKPLKHIGCYEKATSTLGSATQADKHVDEDEILPDATEEGICLCHKPGLTWKGSECGPPDGATGKKPHGEECEAVEACMEPFKCGVPGTAVAGKADKFEEEWTAGKKGRCACPDNKANKGGKCEPVDTTKKKHGEECKSLEACMEPFKCGVPGTAVAGKADKFEEEWTAGKIGRCACKDNKAQKGGKCEPLETTSRSARIIYQSITLQLILACICLFYCSS